MRNNNFEAVQMSKFTIYDQDTGVVLQVMEGKEADAALNGSYIAGEYPGAEYTIVDGAPQRKSDAEIDAVNLTFAWQEFRKRRNGYLTDSDWTQAIDSPLTDAQKQAWQTYRSTLRSLPENTVDPRNPTWPEKPS